MYDASRERVVLFGGYDLSVHFNDTWEWDGVTWTQCQSASAPSARTGYAAYDALNSKVVLFGGDRGSATTFDETWENDTPNAAGWSAYGAGCAGSHGRTPELEYVTLPVLGRSFHLQLRAAPPLSPSLLISGIGPSFIDLTPFGAPGCALRATMEMLQPLMCDSGGSWPTDVIIPVPSSPLFVGASLHFQALMLDLPANALGLISSDAGQAVLGY